MTNSLRIDRWLFYCRFFKTRVLSTGAVNAGHVQLNGERAVPGARVKSGDKIDLLKDRLSYSMTVEDVPARRGPAAEARQFYRESDEAIQKRDEQLVLLKQDRMLMPKTQGRPDKHTRRKLRDRNRH